MWNEPGKERLVKIPGLYETEQIRLQEKKVYLHFFIGSCDWFACEFDGSDLFFGFVVLNGDLEMAEWGLFSLSELKSIRTAQGIEVDCELEFFWQIRSAEQVELICKAQRWQRNQCSINK